MSKKIDERVPRELGAKSLPLHPGIKTPWNQIISFKEASAHCQRYNAFLNVAHMQTMRILIPDYEERVRLMSTWQYNTCFGAWSRPGADALIENLDVFPYATGGFIGSAIADLYDESICMCGRVADISSYRCEKELDECLLDIIGTEYCAASIAAGQSMSDVYGKKRRPEPLAEPGSGTPMVEWQIAEAKGRGDRHCRVMSECLDKYPRDPSPIWDKMAGNISTLDMIKFTKEEDCLKDGQIYHEATEYTFHNGFNHAGNADDITYPTIVMTNATGPIMGPLDQLVAEGRLTREQVDWTLQCICEAMGKTTFIEQFAKEGLRTWMGVPRSIGDDDGRIAGGYIETILQTRRIDYQIEAFNSKEVIYVIDRRALVACYPTPAHVNTYVWIWRGMTKSLVNMQWDLWEEESPEGKLRIKIAKRIDNKQ